MAIYRNVQLSFWTDNKIVDDFTPEDKYFYLYLFTNPQTNLSGCYEVSLKTMSDQTGYNKDTIVKLIERFRNVHKVIDYSESTKEIILLNWHKYNWTRSPKFIKCVKSNIENVKYSKFKDYLLNILSEYTVSIGYQYPMDTTVTVTDTVTDTVNKNSTYIPKTKNQFNRIESHDYNMNQYEQDILGN